MSDGMDPRREPFFRPEMPRYRLEQANTELAMKIADLRAQVQLLRQENERLHAIIDAECPIGALTLAETWREEKAAMQAEIEDLASKENVLSGKIDALVAAADSYRVRYEASQEALCDAQAELWEVGDILNAGASLTAIDAAKRVIQENERLRTALKRIAMGEATGSGDLLGATWRELSLVQIAREALGEGVNHE